MIRENDDSMSVPNTVKIGMVVINRIGFPIVAFAMMWYLCNYTIKENTSVLSRLAVSIEKHNVMADEGLRKILGNDRYEELNKRLDKNG